MRPRAPGVGQTQANTTQNGGGCGVRRKTAVWAENTLTLSAHCPRALHTTVSRAHEDQSQISPPRPALRALMPAKPSAAYTSTVCEMSPGVSVSPPATSTRLAVGAEMLYSSGGSVHAPKFTRAVAMLARFVHVFDAGSARVWCPRGSSGPRQHCPRVRHRGAAAPHAGPSSSPPLRRLSACASKRAETEVSAKQAGRGEGLAIGLHGSEHLATRVGRAADE